MCYFLLYALHSTMFLLIRRGISADDREVTTLHSTMFLLILSECCRQCGITLFTFHDVSINTTTRFYCLKLKFSLHSTMFLLIQKQTQTDLWVFQTLHSTMFLLIHVSHAEHCKFPGITLHSTMFLLILSEVLQYLHN